MNHLDNLMINIYDINSMTPISNSHLTNKLGLKCESRSDYITYNIIKYDNSSYYSKEKSNIVTDYNDINNNIIFSNKDDIYNEKIKNTKDNIVKFIYDIRDIIAQQLNQTIRQANLKRYLKIEELDKDDNLIYNFLQLMEKSNMVTSYKENNGRYYKIGNQIEYTLNEYIDKIKYNSKFEAMVGLYLNNNNISFTCQKTFKDCKNQRCLPFDFYIEVDDINILIEYQGVQHYKPINLFGGEEGLKQRKINDSIKQNFTEDNDIPFIIIPYHINKQKDISNF